MSSSFQAFFRRSHGKSGGVETLSNHSTASDEEQENLLLVAPADGSESEGASGTSSPRGAREPVTPAVMAALRQEAMAVVASLEGVTYLVRFVLHDCGAASSQASLVVDAPCAAATSPEEDGAVWLMLDALARWGDVQHSVDNTFKSAAQRGPLCLMFEGAALPPDAPVALTGVGDRDTVVVVAGAPPQVSFGQGYQSDSDSHDSFDDAMQRWASV